MLDHLYTATVNNGQSYWAIIVDAQRQTLDAWITYESGDTENGLQMMQAAADLEDSVDKHPVTPGSVIPARDMLGDMLLMSDRPGDALAAYEASLKISPKRFYSLYSAGYAAEKAGDTKKAVKYYSELVDVTSRADKENERIAQAKNYINNN
jgi:tetratricopeptide (TPR) repeat protein